MTLSTGLRLGPYEILAPIGAGGMGEVYRARDTRLDRTVAIKVLPAAVAGNAQLRLRFEREARAISALAHPHICTLHDVGSENGVDFLVMEHLEGETLADRVQRSPLPPHDALRYAIEIADALDKAHRRGIVHRDLKPGNVMITRAGAKLLDFGLARTVDTEAVGINSLTVKAPDTPNKPLTAEGTIVGTFQYMAPEQLEGQAADARTDIFAFGAMLYEMLSGRRAFDGKSRASIIAAVLAAEPPPLSVLQPLTPVALDRVVAICLRKDPDERWQSIHDLKLELESLALGLDAGATTTAGRKRAAAGWIAAALIALAAAGAAIWDHRTNHVDQTPSMRLEVMPPAGARFNPTDGPVMISPDGTHIAGIVSGTGADPLYVRSIATGEGRQISGSVGAFDPFWSADGKQLGFFAGGKMKRVDIATGTSTVIAEVGDARGASWAADGTILYTPTPFSGIHRLDVRTGRSTQVTTLDPGRKETGHWRPHLLPDGKRFLYMSLSTDAAASGVYLASLDSKETHRVLDIAAPVTYAEPGFLLYVADGVLYAQPFDAGRAATTGDPFVVARNIANPGEFATAGFSLAKNGMLVYHSRDPVTATTLASVDVATGIETPIDVAGVNIDLSRDGTRLAFSKVESQRTTDIWTWDLRRSVSSRVTFDETQEIGPVWSPDGRRIAYVVTTPRGAEVRVATVSGGASEKILDPVEMGIEIVDWSLDGRTLLAERGTLANRTDLVTIDLAARTITPFSALPPAEHSGRFSPDGRWIAYESDDSGRNEIFVRPFPLADSKWQVTNGGGSSPRWTADGKTLFYLTRDQTLMSVPVLVTGSEFDTGTPKTHARIGTLDYVITPDGSVAITSRRDSPTAVPVVVMTKWR